MEKKKRLYLDDRLQRSFFGIFCLVFSYARSATLQTHHPPSQLIAV